MTPGQQRRILLGVALAIGISCGIFGTQATSNWQDQLSKFRSSLQGLKDISQLEYCREEDKNVSTVSRASAEFEKLKLTVESGEVPFSSNPNEALIKNPIFHQNHPCKGRLTGESYLHYRFRLASNAALEIQSAFNQLNLDTFKKVFQKLSDDFSSLEIYFKNSVTNRLAWAWVFIQTGEWKTSFHQLWIENPGPEGLGIMPFLEAPYPSSNRLATLLINPDSPASYRLPHFVPQMIQFLLPEPQRWIVDPVEPQLLELPEQGFCQKIAINPLINLQVKSVWKHLRLYYEGCQKRRIELGKIPQECSSEKIRKALTIVCFEHTSADKTLEIISSPLQWEGLPTTLQLSTRTLLVPEDYFHGEPQRLPYLAYRLAVQIQATLFPDLQSTQLNSGEAPSNRPPNSELDFDRPQLLTDSHFELSRLQILETINPLTSRELDPKIQSYFWYDSFGPRMDRFRINFLRNLHRLKGELE